MDYDSPYKVDSPFNYDFEGGEVSPESGRSSPGTIRDNASDCGTQTDDQMGTTDERVTTMRVHLDNTPENIQTPQDIARKIRNKFHQSRQNEDRRNLQSFNNNRITTTSEQGTSTNSHSYEHNRPINNQNRLTTESYTSPPLPNYPPPMRPPPPSDYATENLRTQTHVQQQLFTKTANSRPNNLRFPYAVTPRSNNKKSFLHQSTNEQTPTATVMETIWFQDKDHRTLNSPHSSNCNPLLSYRNWTNMPFDDTSMDYDSPYKVDSPFNYDVEEGEVSPESGRSSPGTIRDNASDCGTQTDDQMGTTDETVTTMRVHLDNTPENIQTPQDIARKIRNKFHQSRQNEDRRNLQSFNNNRITTTSEQGTSTNSHSYEHNRPINNQNRLTTESYTSPPLPNYPPPMRPPPPSDYATENLRTQTRVQQQLFTKTANSRPNNLRFPYAVTPRSNNKKSFFHQ